MRKIILSFIAVVIIIGACGRSVDRTSPSNSAPVTTASAKPSSKAEPILIIGEERKPIVAAATKGLELERDKVEKISFYSAKSPNFLRSRLEAYVSLPDDMKPLLRMKATYYGDDWVFYDSIKVMVDDSVIYERDFSHSTVVRNNNGGSVWETADFLADARDLLLLHAIAGAKSATIRFSGRERRHDHEVTAKERKDIQKVLDAYEKLDESLFRKPEKTSA